MSESTETKAMPPAAAVQVLRYRPNAQTGVLEPWPVATIEIDQAGKIVFRGDAGKAYEPREKRACDWRIRASVKRCWRPGH